MHTPRISHECTEACLDAAETAVARLCEGYANGDYMCYYGTEDQTAYEMQTLRLFSNSNSANRHDNTVSDGADTRDRTVISIDMHISTDIHASHAHTGMCTPITISSLVHLIKHVLLPYDYKRVINMLIHISMHTKLDVCTDILVDVLRNVDSMYVVDVLYVYAKYLYTSGVRNCKNSCSKGVLVFNDKYSGMEKPCNSMDTGNVNANTGISQSSNCVDDKYSGMDTGNMNASTGISQSSNCVDASRPDSGRLSIASLDNGSTDINVSTTFQLSNSTDVDSGRQNTGNTDNDSLSNDNTSASISSMSQSRNCMECLLYDTVSHFVSIVPTISNTMFVLDRISSFLQYFHDDTLNRMICGNMPTSSTSSHLHYKYWHRIYNPAYHSTYVSLLHTHMHSMPREYFNKCIAALSSIPTELYEHYYKINYEGIDSSMYVGGTYMYSSTNSNAYSDTNSRAYMNSSTYVRNESVSIYVRVLKEYCVLDMVKQLQMMVYDTVDVRMGVADCIDEIQQIIYDHANDGMYANMTGDIMNNTVNGTVNDSTSIVINSVNDTVNDSVVNSTVSTITDDTVNNTLDSIVNNTIDSNADSTVDNTMNSIVDGNADSTLNNTVGDTVNDTVNNTVDDTVNDSNVNDSAGIAINNANDTNTSNTSSSSANTSDDKDNGNKIDFKQLAMDIPMAPVTTTLASILKNVIVVLSNDNSSVRARLARHMDVLMRYDDAYRDSVIRNMLQFDDLNWRYRVLLIDGLYRMGCLDVYGDAFANDDVYYVRKYYECKMNK